ncbi:uncharacterized protein LOC127714084 isoform X2 [Mytilus californianus]|uniref:uncharacterized protein LOC127714084 isoform X2 n=1 Tax=Mytilus californianus TaxID=6549 RepID=UPI0022463CA3|nr:uncharacterized protein LOC127714084 isoform X2 [Mytilus californianus]
MKKLKQNQKSNTSTVEPEENELLNTREKYHKEIAKTKRNILERSEKSEVKEVQAQDKQDHLVKVVDIQHSTVGKSDDESKFHELRKYLLSDTSDKESSPTIKVKSPSKKKQTRNKDKMLDIRSEAEKSPVKNFRSTRGSSVEKKDKGSLSPTKKSSPNVKLELNNKDSPIIGNKTPLSAGKKVKHTPSPEKLSVITPESPRTGSRQRSPNLRYADDMVMFPLKLPKRQIFKKDSNTENCNNNDVSLPKTSLSTECQTSQLYSLLTGTILKSDCTKAKNPTETNNSEKQVSDIQSVNQKVETNNLNGDISDRSCEMTDAGNKTEIEPTDTSSNKVSINQETDIKETIPEAVSEPKAENSDKDVGKLEALQNLSNVIDQIIVESVQEDIPAWAVYEDKPLRLPRKPRRKRKSLQEKIIDGELGYTVVTTIKRKGPVETPTSSGDEDDLKGKRRVTKPILKRSIIRMSPALGLLVGHDEDGFTMFDEHKKSMSDNDDNGENDETEQKDRKKGKKKDLNLFKIGKEQKTNSDQKQMPTKSSSTVISVSKPISTQPQMRLIGSAGTKATIVSGSQSVPCIIVPSSSTIGGQTLLTLQGSNASNISLIPSNKISLIGTPTNKVIPTSSISPVSPIGPPMVSMIPSSNVRPVQPVQVVTSVQSMLKTPTTKTFFRLSQGQLISSSGQPLLSTKVLPGTKGQIISSSGSSLLSTKVLSGTTTTAHTFTTTSPVISLASQSNPLNIPPNSKVLILKKSDIPNTSGTILVNSSSPVSGRPGMSLLKKSPVTVSKPELASITTSSKPVVTEKLSVPVVSPKKPIDSESGQSSTETLENEQKLLPLDDLISKVKTNMDSSVQLPKIFTSDIFMDYESENDSEMSEGHDDDMEEEQNVANETKPEKNGLMDKSEIDDSVDLQVHCQASDKGQITDPENSVIENKASKEAEDIEKSQSDKNMSVNEIADKENESNENNLSGTEKDMEIESKQCKQADTNLENIKEDQNVTVNLGSGSSKIIKSPDTVTVVEVKIEIDSKYVDKPQKEIQPKTNDGKDKVQSAEVKADSAKDQTNSLQSKLKKAMESLSNVKSVLAAKTDAKFNKVDLKPDSQHGSEKEQTNMSKEKTPETDNQNKHKDSETVCGNLSDLEDHGGESKRKNIFDLIMEDYQSPGKEGTVKESEGKKNVIEIQESPVKKSPNKAVNSVEKILESPENISAERSLLDVGLTPKPETNDMDKDSKEEKCVAISDELSHDNITDKKNYDNASKTDEQSEIRGDISVVKESKNNDNLSQIDNNSQDVISLDGSSKFENEMEVSDDDIDKVQNEMDTESESKHLTMADKLLAKFKKWEDEESVPKTHITKIPLKLKICSSPGKSFIVSSSHSSKKKKMTNMRKVDGRLVPMNSTQREIKEPLPMTVLFNPETEIKDKLSAFSSQSLENFIENLTIEVKEDEKVDDADDDFDDGDEDDDNLVDDDEDDDEDEDEDDDDEDEDENENNENDSDMSMDEHEPDFDEIDGVLFMSFPSKNALKAHVEVERRTKLGTDENMLLGMTRMRNMRRKQGYILSKYNKKVGNKILKDKDNISQNLRGMHKTLAKYQRLYKQELQWLDSPNEEGTFMHKTSDITKIKGWKNKVDNVTDDVENAKAEIENGGKLHWRTEARLAKNLRPDELKEYGLNIKKKRRKNIIYTQRKGMSKGDRSQKSENGQEEIIYEDYSRSNSNDLNDIQFIDEDIEINMTKDGDTESHADIAEEKDENIIFPSDDEVQDEELVRIYDRERMKETDKVKNSERQRMIFKSKTLKMRLNYNLQDIQVIRKLGGHNIRRRKNADGEYEGDYTVIMDTSANSSRPSTPEITQQEEPEKETPPKKGRKPKLELMASVLTGNMATAACTAIPKEYSRKKPVAKKIIKETDGLSKSPESGQLTTCDKPGCRYGCICHLCMFTDQSPEADRNVLKCEKEYCRLGCICDSIEAHKEKDNEPHCGKPDCMVVCYCDDLAMDESKNKKVDEDYRFTGQKKTAKYAALPKRESTYRLAKNLDAVSRKAMLYYESSEMFVDQKKTRRRKSKESTDSPQVYMDVDVADYEPLQQVSTVPSKSRKQEFLVHRPVPIKPKPQLSSSSLAGKRDEMIDFSNIKNEISSQESWNLSDLSEYDDIEVNSDEDLQTTTCARTAVYNAVKREKPQLGITCNCGKLSHGNQRCSADDGKFNIPEDILSSGKWHTQWICLRSKGHSLDDTTAEGLRLLEVISNCNYEDFKAKILSRLTSHISHSEYPPLKNFLVGEFKVSILPKSNKPAIIPPEVMAKLPNSVYSIRIQIIKDPYVSNPQIINLIDDTEINVKEVKSGHISKSASKLGNNSLSIVTPVENNRAQNAGKKLDRNSELAKHLQSDVHPTMTPITSSCTIVAGGISGLSQLQISRPIGSVSGFSPAQKPILPDNVSSKNVLPGSIVKSIPVSLSGPGVVVSTGSNVNAIPVSLCGPGMVTPVMLIPDNSVSLGNAVVKAAVPVTQPMAVEVSSTLTSSTSIVMANKYQNFPGYVVKGVTSIPNISPGITLSSSLQDQQNLKHKLPDQTDISDQKKLRIETSLGQSVNTTGSLIQPIPSVGENADTSIGQVSVLRCVVCNNILTAEDITSWVLSQDSIQEKICVKCKSGQKVETPVLQQKSLSHPQSRSSPIVIDADNSNSTLAENITQDVEMVESKELVKTIEAEASKIRSIVKEVDDSALQLDLVQDDGESANSLQDETLQKHSTKFEENQTKTIIDLSSDEENTTDKLSDKNDKSVKKTENVIENQSENEEDELEAAIRDAQDDYRDNIVRNLSDDNESQEEELNKNTSAPKSSVIVIDDEDDDAVTLEKRKVDHGGSEGSAAKKSKDEDEDVDVISFSEGDSFETSLSESDIVTSSWHNSSCSLNNAMLRKKRKAQLDLIQNKQLYQAEVKEGFASSEDYRKYKLTKERSRRQEMQNLYKEMADLVMTENEVEDLSNHWKAFPKTNILDKAIACIKTEASSRSQFIGKVEAFKIYQKKLQKRLVELKEYHIGRGISKEKLESQLDKIAVVCGKIYDHLPEIKKHIKDKKGPDRASTSMPPPVKQKSKKTSKQAKRSKVATSKHKSAEIYIDNPEEYENEEQIGQVATPLSSLPGSYTTSTPVRMQRPAPSLGGPYLPRSNATLTLQGTNIQAVPISSIPAAAIKVQMSNTRGIPTPIPRMSSIAIRFPVQAVRVQSANSVPMPTVSVQGQRPGAIPKNITVQSVNTIVGTPLAEGDPLQVRSIVPAIVQSSQSSLIPSSLSNVLDPLIVPQNVTTFQSSLSTPVASALESSSAKDGSIHTDIVQNLGQHSSTSGFSAVLGQIIKKNIVEEMGSELGMENIQTSLNVQQKDIVKTVESSAPSIPQYDVNLLKDQILDDSTGELIAVVMNEDDNDSSDSSSKNDENSQNSKSNEDTAETSATVETISKTEESCPNSEDKKEECSVSSEIDKKISNQTEELETDEAPNIESLLNDIKSLCQEDETPLHQPSLKSSIEKQDNKQDNKILSKEVESENVLPNNERLDQVDGDIFNFSGAKDIGNLSESDSNNSARTNVYMEDSDGNVSIAGEISDGPVDNESNTPKIVSVMSISDVLGDNFKDIDEPLEMGPDGDNMTALFNNDNNCSL